MTQEHLDEEFGPSWRSLHPAAVRFALYLNEAERIDREYAHGPPMHPGGGVIPFRPRETQMSRIVVARRGAMMFIARMEWRPDERDVKRDADWLHDRWLRDNPCLCAVCVRAA